ncbi:putative mitochondrial protein [Andalucia godoyi]|uniref:Putative mitochondrial protein n=1 Tax=Andalucia godoyi TaxID=505711 RepID=A0A8K0F2F0_ANDGO|nr:putative mitochondrial protein [Andalucia godoyi]|eukprot:ANDGO_07535.mRNA.1 putative mitochondrial protein
MRDLRRTLVNTLIFGGGTAGAYYGYKTAARYHIARPLLVGITGGAIVGSLVAIYAARTVERIVLRHDVHKSSDTE